MVSQFPSPAQDYMQTQIDLNAELVKDPAATYVLRVRSEAMENTGIFDGDEIIVHTWDERNPYDRHEPLRGLGVDRQGHDAH